MKQRLLIFFSLLFLLLAGCAIRIFAQDGVWADGVRKEYLTDEDVTALHQRRVELDKAQALYTVEVRRIEKEHGASENVDVTVYDDYVIVRDRQ